MKGEEQKRGGWSSSALSASINFIAHFRRQNSYSFSRLFITVSTVHTAASISVFQALIVLML